MYILSALTALLLTPLLATAASPAEHYLKTSVVKSAHKDTGSNKNNLFVQSYHTGAGINDVVLVPEKKGAAPFFLNDTTAQFDLKSPGISWFMTMGGDTNYAGWESVGINTFNGSPDFFINATGLQWNQTYYGFGGWLGKYTD